MSGWAALATERANVLRAHIAGGRRGTPTLLLAGLRCTPPQPLAGQEAGELLRRLRWETPHQAKETYVVGLHDIRTGDVLTVGAVSYTVRGVAEWTPPREGVLPVTHLVLEEVTG